MTMQYSPEVKRIKVPLKDGLVAVIEIYPLIEKLDVEVWHTCGTCVKSSQSLDLR